MGDDDAADVVHGQILPDHGRQAEHVVRRDGRARQVVELAYFQIADAAQAGDGPDKVRTADSGHGRTGHAVMCMAMVPPVVMMTTFDMGGSVCLA